MKAEHKEILDLITNYLNEPDAEHLRFGQVLFNLDINQFEENNPEYGLRDINNDSDKRIVKRIKNILAS